jgi:predicted RNA-binding protein with EMAP domain
MTDPMMYREDAFVVLESGQEEIFLTPEELAEKLQTILEQQQDHLPHDLQKFASVAEQVKYLINTACELDVGSGQFLQWYAVRLEK